MDCTYLHTFDSLFCDQHQGVCSSGKLDHKTDLHTKVKVANETQNLQNCQCDKHKTMCLREKMALCFCARLDFIC